MRKTTFARAWCDDCLMSCYWSHDEQTGITRHVGPTTSDLSQAQEPLRRQGYYISHAGDGVFTATLYKSASIAMPLDWQIAMQQHETIDQNQDW